MIAVRKVEERQRERLPRRLVAPALAGRQAAMRLHELWLTPGERVDLNGQSAYEIITYVVAGTLAHAVGTQTTALLCAGEFQRAVIGMSAPAQSQINPSLSETAHVVQLLLYDPRLELAGGQEQRRFSLAQRRGLMCSVAAAGGDSRSLPMQSAIALYSAVLDPGQHMVHGLAAAHGGLLHVVSGELSIGGYVLGPGDTAHAQDERALAFTAREHAEVLLGDLREMSSF